MKKKYIGELSYIQIKNEEIALVQGKSNMVSAVLLIGAIMLAVLIIGFFMHNMFSETITLITVLIVDILYAFSFKKMIIKALNKTVIKEMIVFEKRLFQYKRTNFKENEFVIKKRIGDEEEYFELVNGRKNVFRFNSKATAMEFRKVVNKEFETISIGYYSK